HDKSNIVSIGNNEIEPLAQDGRALLGGLGSPCRESLGGGLDGFLDGRDRKGRDRAYDRTVCRVGHVDLGAVGGVYPASVNKALRFEQRGVFQSQHNKYPIPFLQIMIVQY